MNAPRHAGRRVAEREPRRRRRPRPPAGGRPSPRLGRLALVVVVATAAALTYAGTTETPTAQPLPTTRSAAVGRSLSCPGNLPGATATAGTVGQVRPGSVTLDDDPVARRSRVGIAHRTVHVHTDADAASQTYAFRSATGGSWLAAGTCPVPRAQWWFVGVGGSEVHGSVLQIDNPREGTAMVDVHVFGPKGPIRAPGLQGIQVPSRHTVRLDLAEVAPAVGDLAAHVETSRGLVSVSAAEHWAQSLVAKRTREWVAGQPAAARSLTLAGLTPRSRHATLLITNPSEKEAVAHVSFVGKSGTFAPARHDVVTVPPNRVLPVRLDDVLGTRPVAVRVHAQVPVAATVRSRLDGDAAYATAAQPVGSRALAGLPRHARATLQLVSRADGRGPDSGGAGSSEKSERTARSAKPKDVTYLVTSYGVHGAVLARHKLVLPAAGEQTYRLPRGAAAVELTRQGRAGGGSVAVLALERPGKENTAMVPLVSTDTGTEIPVVRPAW